MKIYKQHYDSYGDKLFEGYFLTKEAALKYRRGKFVSPNPNCCNWNIEEIEVQE